MKNTKNEWLKAGVIFFGLVLFSGGGGGFSAAQNDSDILVKLGLEPATAKESIMASLASGSVYNYEAIEAFKSLPASARATIVQAGLNWIKAYVGTAEFKTAYQKFRNGKKPEAPAARPSADEALKKQKADFEKQIAETRKSMAALDAETRKTMEANIQQMRSQLEAMEKDPQQKVLMGQMTEMARAEDKKRYEEQLKTWEEKSPTDPRVLIKKRINDFLAASADVDFSAKLTPCGEKMVFAREDYERKSTEWKVCFRAGREATEVARAFAKSWLAELAKN
jgi:hypothetical protein